MVLFFSQGEVDSDEYILYCYDYYRDIVQTEEKPLPKTVSIIRKPKEKPIFDTDLVHFSLSHSNGVIMLAISDSEIGCDLEKIRTIDYKKFDFIECEDEEDFFFKWTERESYLKKIGVGLSKLRSPIPEDEHFEHFPVFEEYHACVCGKEQNVLAYQIHLPLIK